MRLGWSTLGQPCQKPPGAEKLASPPCTSLRRSTWSGPASSPVNYLTGPLLCWGCSLLALCGLTLEQQGLSCCLLSLRRSPLMTRRGIYSQSSAHYPSQPRHLQPRAHCRRSESHH